MTRSVMSTVKIIIFLWLFAVNGLTCDKSAAGNRALELKYFCFFKWTEAFRCEDKAAYIVNFDVSWKLLCALDIMGGLIGKQGTSRHEGCFEKHVVIRLQVLWSHWSSKRQYEADRGCLWRLPCFRPDDPGSVFNTVVRFVYQIYQYSLSWF